MALDLRTRRENPRLESRSSRVGISKRQATVAIIAIEVLILYALLGHEGWAYDDNLILILAGHSGLTWHWLTSLILEHWGIGYHFVFSGVHSLMPLDHRWALIGSLAILGASVYLLQRIVSVLFGGTWLPIGVAAYFGLSVIFVRPLEWFAGGLAYLPNTFFDLLCLYAYLRFQIDSRRHWALLAGAALAGGLLFYEKPVYMLLYLVLLKILFLSGDLRPRALSSALWGERLIWAALAFVTALWAVGFRLSGGGTGVAVGSVSISQYLSYFKVLWFQTLTPAAVDLSLPAAGLNAGQIGVAVALQGAWLLAVVVSCRRKPSAWRAWLLLLITVIFTGAVVARSRIPEFGPAIGGDLRYLLDFSWLIPLAVSFAFRREPVLHPRLDPSRSGIPLTFRFSWRSGVAGLALAAYVLAATLTGAKLDRGWGGRRALTWETSLQRGLGWAERSGAPPVLADASAPSVIVAPVFDPYNRLSWVVPLFYTGVQVDGVLHGPLLMVDPHGVVHRAGVARRLGQSTTDSLFGSGQVSVTGALSIQRSSSATCIAAGANQVLIERRLPGVREAIGRYYALLAYTSRVAGRFPVYVDSGRGYPQATDRYLQVAQGSATSILFLDSRSPSRLMLTLAPGHTLCLRRLDVVTLRAVSDHRAQPPSA